jgi:hypothetical protein
MKKLIILVSILICLPWPVNFYLENRHTPLQINTVFKEDYQARQKVLRNINLYPSVLMARMFQNKAGVVLDKYLDNFFSLLDPNYYFFGSHPREVVGGQNYTRLPILTLLPLIWFLFKSKIKSKKNILFFMSLAIIFLSFFTNFYQYDLILWPSLVFCIAVGLGEMYKKHSRLTSLFFILLLSETFLEIWKSLI